MNKQIIKPFLLSVLLQAYKKKPDTRQCFAVYPDCNALLANTKFDH